ncbi:IclR family transcriptional regulator [Hydrogenophaga sp. BPS33]|uniref:IclR family transcriptional regulator n=1 Tax=Hydrogenophaga sp. BPS33 TaxID=2651974 RepID=UPI00131FA5F2|nr:IclR family transcriptional regulator [Hydrogenophaga sp. BPS33]QHE87513.1 IclR family transcriptional regulator [Hydrogenophaga sp. BPS33]
MPPRNPESTTRSFTPPRAIARVLQVVRVLALGGRSMGLAELVAEFGMPRTSLFAIMKGLEREGYVVFENERYSLGPESVKLGHAILQARRFPDSVKPALEKLGGISGETVILSALTDDRQHVVYIDVLEAQSSLRFTVKVGTQTPLNASATGQATLAFMPKSERDAYLKAGNFTRFTPHTVATTADLRKALVQAREACCAVTVDGTVLAAVGIAAPYFNQQGQVMGAVNVAGPTARLVEHIPRLKQAVIECGEAVSHILGYTGAYPPRDV